MYIFALLLLITCSMATPASAAQMITDKSGTINPLAHAGDTIGAMLQDRAKAPAQLLEKGPANVPAKAPAKAPTEPPVAPKTPAKAPLKPSPKPSPTPTASPSVPSKPSSSAAAACPLRPKKRSVEDFAELESWMGFDERRGRGYTVVVLG
ncbi:hypothetical protein B5807_06710 [Epicoccum nigrum]|uniref:Uncharacterized protein n=1 Tax=Epicoccum nigrum TaxID=105696 RepID=A0A1Y2LWE9_EPING|nr:hypothetical protein B5807_06710 [Epicoccum nigrum]